jgi:hypothetical protein
MLLDSSLATSNGGTMVTVVMRDALYSALYHTTPLLQLGATGKPRDYSVEFFLKKEKKESTYTCSKLCDG